MENLTRDFGTVRAVDSLSLEVPAGMVFGSQALPAEWKVRLAEVVMTAGVTKIIRVVMAVLAVLDIGLLLAAMARFQRARLILD